MFLHLQKVDIWESRVHSRRQEAVFLPAMSCRQGSVGVYRYKDIDVGCSVITIHRHGARETWPIIRMDNIGDIASTCLPPRLKSYPFERYYPQQFDNSHLLS